MLIAEKRREGGRTDPTDPTNPILLYVQLEKCLKRKTLHSQYSQLVINLFILKPFLKAEGEGRGSCEGGWAKGAAKGEKGGGKDVKTNFFSISLFSSVTKFEHTYTDIQIYRYRYIYDYLFLAERSPISNSPCALSVASVQF